MHSPTFLEEAPAAPELELRPDDDAPPPRRAGTLLREHSFPVSYPDLAEGRCEYERLGPACHRFFYSWKDGTAMPRQYVTRPLGNRPADIEEKGRELAAQAFAEAIERERRDRFARVSYEPGESTASLKFKWRLCACQARELGGKYAICLPVGSHLVRLSTTYDTIEEAADRWRDRVHDGAVVCCLHRRNRRWERPKFDPLNAEPEYGKEAPPCS